MSTLQPQGTGNPHTATISQEPERLIIGRSVWTSNAAELGTGRSGELVPNHHASHEVIMAYSEFEKGAGGDYTCTLGFRVSRLDVVPDGFSACIMPAQTCAVIPVSGNPAETIPATWMRILELFTPGYHLKRSFRCDADVFLIGGSAAETNARILIGIESAE